MEGLETLYRPGCLVGDKGRLLDCIGAARRLEGQLHSGHTHCRVLGEDGAPSVPQI